MVIIGCIIGVIFGYVFGYYLFDVVGDWVINIFLNFE